VPGDGRILPSPMLAGNPLPGRRSAASGPSFRHLWKAGSVTTCFLGCRVWWIGFAKEPHLQSPARAAFLSLQRMVSTPCPVLVTCYVSLYHSLVKGESHAPVFLLRSYALIPTGAHSRPAALPKPIIISVPKPHCCKGSASKPYVEFPPHTAPLGMGVGPAQARAVKVVVHDLS
jgi:hypothetical protein